jgi:hypothetical protein
MTVETDLPGHALAGDVDPGMGAEINIGFTVEHPTRRAR